MSAAIIRPMLWNRMQGMISMVQSIENTWIHLRDLRLQHSSQTSRHPRILEDNSMAKKLVEDVKNLAENCATNDYSMRSHHCGQLSLQNINENVSLFGWIQFKRLSGKFMVLRDCYGSTQIILSDDAVIEGTTNTLREIPLESIVNIEGYVAERPEKQKKNDSSTGLIEVVASRIKVLSSPEKESLSYRDIETMEEPLSLELRYLALRRQQMQQKLRLRSSFLNRVRNWFHSNNFVEVETPTLIRRTPGGAREFPVLTKQKGLFYSLCQSPQLLKQLLMVGGMDRYYQIARCYRDERSKPNRQPEFTQIDIELAFTDRELVLKMVEDLLRSCLCIEDQTPFPVITYDECIRQYGTDKPDTGSFLWIVDFPMFMKDKNGNLEAAHHPFTMPSNVKELFENPEKAVALSYDLVFCGQEVGGGSVRIHDDSLQRYIFEKILKLTTVDIEYFLKALSHGAPPHAGIALGVDRLMMILTGSDSIRDVVAFPKSADGRDTMTGAPSAISNDDKTYYGLV